MKFKLSKVQARCLCGCLNYGYSCDDNSLKLYCGDLVLFMMLLCSPWHRTIFIYPVPLWKGDITFQNFKYVWHLSHEPSYFTLYKKAKTKYCDPRKVGLSLSLHGKGWKTIFCGGRVWQPPDNSSFFVRLDDAYTFLFIQSVEVDFICAYR